MARAVAGPAAVARRRRRGDRRRTCAADARQPIGGRCSAGPGPDRGRWTRRRSPRPCAAPAGGPGSRRSGRTGCGTRWPARWSQPRCRCRRSARCCATAACRAPPSTRAPTSSSCGHWRSRGREADGSMSDARRPRRRLPAAAPRARVQARTRRALLPQLVAYLEAAGASTVTARAGDRVGAAAGRRAAPHWADAAGHRARVRRLPADDRPGDRGPAAPTCSPPATPPRRPRTCGRRPTSAGCWRRRARCGRRCERRPTRRCSGCSRCPACGSARRSRSTATMSTSTRRASRSATRKFERARLVPLHPTTTDALRRYASRPRPPVPTAAIARRSSCPAPGPRLTAATSTRRSTTHHRDRPAHPVTARPRIQTSAQLCRAHADRLATIRRRHRAAHRRAVDLPRARQPSGTYWYLSATPELMALAADRLHAPLRRPTMTALAPACRPSSPTG